MVPGVGWWVTGGFKVIAILNYYQLTLSNKEIESGVHPTTEIYDINSEEWTIGPQLPLKPLFGHCAVQIDDDQYEMNIISSNGEQRILI